jgi:hypothetical protein
MKFSTSSLITLAHLRHDARGAINVPLIAKGNMCSVSVETLSECSTPQYMQRHNAAYVVFIDPTDKLVFLNVWRVAAVAKLSWLTKCAAHLF